MVLHSGSWTATNSITLVVEHKSQNFLGRDILAKLGLTLTQQHTNKDRRLQKQPVLTQQSYGTRSKTLKPNSTFNTGSRRKKDQQPDINVSTVSEDSENAPLLSPTRTPEEKRRAKQKQQSLTQGPSSSTTKTPTEDGELYSHEQLDSIAKNNQKQQQQKRRTQQKRKTTTRKQQPRQ